MSIHKLIEKVEDKSFEELSKEEQQKAINEKLFKIVNGGEGFESKPYFDIVNNPTIGHGISIRHHEHKLFDEMNITNTKHQDAYKKILADTKADLVKDIDKINSDLKEKADTALLDKLNSKYKQLNPKIDSNSTVSSNNATISNSTVSSNNATISNSTVNSNSSNQTGSTTNTTQSNVSIDLQLNTNQTSNSTNSTITLNSNSSNQTNTTNSTVNSEFFTTPSVAIDKKNIEQELKTLGITDKKQIEEYKKIWESEITAFEAEKRKEGNKEREKYDVILQTALDEKYAELNPKLTNKKFELSEPQSCNIFDKILVENQNNLDKILNKETFPRNSKEYAALFDLAYNGGIGIIKNNEDLMKALTNNNRAETWCEIRYELNEGASKSPGIANRRVSQTNMFGLYETDKDSITEDEAKNIMKMYNGHKDNILKQEKDYPSSYEGSNSIKKQLEPVVTYFEKMAKEDTDKDVKLSIDSIMVNNTKGTDKDDLIFADNATIDAGKGNDVIYAKGISIVSGNEGDDTYIYKKGDGNLTIQDNGADKNDKLIIQGFNSKDATFALSEDKKDLVITFGKEEGNITIKDYQGGGKIEKLAFDDKELSAKDIEDKLQNIKPANREYNDEDVKKALKEYIGKDFIDKHLHEIDAEYKKFATEYEQLQAEKLKQVFNKENNNIYKNF